MKAISVEAIATAVGGQIIAGEKDIKISSVSINSKEIQKGALFVPIIGERVDAHNFIEMALEAGAVATFTSKEMEQYVPGKVYIKVEDTLKALQKAAAYYRSLFSVKLIGITGSVGKTTTKEMVAAALETGYKVLKTKGNMNSQIGLPLMMFHIEEDTELAVIEMGMSEKGEMNRLSRIAKPDIVILTNIGVSHIGQLGSKENIRREKMNIVNNFTGEQKVYVNGNDPLLYEIKQFSEDAKKNVYPKEEFFDEETKDKLDILMVHTYGTGSNCEYLAKDIKNNGECTAFTYCFDGKEEEIKLSVLGVHNVNNATVALAVAGQLGIEPAVAKKGLEQYKPIEMRGQIYEHKGFKIIDDTYNASPDSMKSGISVLMDLCGIKRRIAVLADVLELGEVSHDCHYEVGSYIADAVKEEKKIDMLVTVGTEAQAIASGVKDRNGQIEVHSFLDCQEAISYLSDIVRADDGLLVKGSRGMHMEQIVDALKKM